MADNAKRPVVIEADASRRRQVPSWVITVVSVVSLILAWEFFGRDVNPVFGSYPSAIAEAGWEITKSGVLPISC